MPKVKCDVKTCTYNYENNCTRKNIDVGGYTSNKKCETFCESFVPKSDVTMNYEFASFDGKKNLKMPIYCDVVNCVYENHQRCHADSVKITYSEDLNTELANEFGILEKHSKASTECSSFESKD